MVRLCWSELQLDQVAADHDWGMDSEEGQGGEEAPSQEVHCQLRGQSWACPNLDGKYDGQYDDDNYGDGNSKIDDDDENYEDGDVNLLEDRRPAPLHGLVEPVLVESEPLSFRFSFSFSFSLSFSFSFSFSFS